MAKIKATVQGKTVEAETMSFTPIQEPWSFYKLEDGTVIKLKLVVSNILKLPGTDAVTGLPQFLVRSSNVVGVEPATAKSETH
jgi:hypothetical protein